VDTPLVRGSTLTRGGALPADMVGDFLVDMLGRVRDAVLLEPVVAPFGAAS
jgi:hypothetical protein